MGRVYRPWYTKPDDKHGRCRVQSKKWAIEYTDADGKTRRRSISTNKRIAESALAQAQEREARKRHGIADPIADSGLQNRPMAELVPEYLKILSQKNCDSGYQETVEFHLDQMVVKCGWHIWLDLTTDTLLDFLDELRSRKRSPATLNSYMRSAKSFANWYADKIDIVSPLKRLKPFNEKVDRRRSRRILTDLEFSALLVATESAPKRINTLIPPLDRSVLYRVAAYTGLRASELASLTPESFHLAQADPVVVVAAKDSKGRREESVPLPDHLVAFLKQWLADKKPKGKLWPGRWAELKGQVKWLERDCKRAGLGKGVTFHGLKRQYVTRLIRTGANIDQVRKLARHKSAQTTLDYYAVSDLPELRAVANKLRPPG